MSSEEEEIKKKLIRRQQEAMQNQFSNHAMQQQHEQQQMELLKIIMNEILEPKARERLNNIKVVKPEVATQIMIYLAQAYQAGQIRGKLTENDIVSILKRLDSPKDFNIKRK